MNYKKLSIIVIFLFIGSVVFSQSVKNPIVMFVKAASGLNIHSEPSINSNIKETLLYGQRIVLCGKSKTTVTINGITDYWYEIYYNYGWVFGGYLSASLPTDAPFVLGLWEDGRTIFNFYPDYTYSVGIKQSEWFDEGKWNLNKNTLTLIQLSSREKILANPDISEIVISVINENNIKLTYREKEYNLIRSDYPYIYK